MREQKKIKTAWPQLNYSTAEAVVILMPSRPAIYSTRWMCVE